MCTRWIYDVRWTKKKRKRKKARRTKKLETSMLVFVSCVSHPSEWLNVCWFDVFFVVVVAGWVQHFWPILYSLMVVFIFFLLHWNSIDRNERANHQPTNECVHHFSWSFVNTMHCQRCILCCITQRQDTDCCNETCRYLKLPIVRFMYGCYVYSST